MANVTVTAKNVRALNGSGDGGQVPGVFPYNAGGAGDVGDSVYLAADGDVEVTDASSAGTAASIGIVVSVGTFGALTFAAGDRVAVCRHGKVAGFSGATPGSLAYASDDAGELADAAGSTSRVVGRFDSATVLFVNPPA